MKRKMVEFIDGYEFAVNSESGIEDRLGVGLIRRSLLMLLDIGFYFMTLHPTVASSYKLSLMILKCGEYFKKFDTEGMEVLNEPIFRWTSQLSKCPTFTKDFYPRSAIPLELLNIVLAVSDLIDNPKNRLELVELLKGPEGAV